MLTRTDGKVMQIIDCCIICTKEQPCIEVPLKSYNEWKRGAYIQDAMPQLSPDEREMLISRICGKCFDGMFPEDDE